MGLWRLDHDLTTSPRLSHAPNLPKIHSHLHKWNSVGLHTYAHPQHIKVLKHVVYTCYECGMQFAMLLSLNHEDLTTSLGLWTLPPPKFPKNPPPPAQAEQCKGNPICPSTAYQSAKTLCMYILWMWDAVCKALEPQP